MGHHFARPGNRFWPALHRSGFTDRQLHPSEERVLLELGFGITNLVARSSASAAELTNAEYIAGARRLKRKALRYRPAWIAFVGVGAYRIAFGKRRAGFGAQDDMLGPSRLWVLPSTSGLNANHHLPELTVAFRELREAAL